MVEELRERGKVSEDNEHERRAVVTDLQQESDAFCSELYVGIRSEARWGKSIPDYYSISSSHVLLYINIHGVCEQGS